VKNHMVLAKARQGRSKSNSQGVRTQITATFAPTLIHKLGPDGHTVLTGVMQQSPEPGNAAHWRSGL